MPTAAAVTSQGVAPAIAAAVEGTDGQLWVQAPQLASGWQSLGGRIIAAPAVAAAPNPVGSPPAQPLFVATGTDHRLYIRSLTAGWRPLSKSAYCLNGPAAVIIKATLTVACEGTDHGLWENTATVPTTTLPQVTTRWTGLGGVLAGGPAVAPVGGAMTFFARGTNSEIWTRTLTAGFRRTSWFCAGSPAAAFDPVSGTTVFACDGSDHQLWQAANDGAGWGSAMPLGGSLIGGVGIAAVGMATEIVAEGSDHAAWVHGPNGWASLGGRLIGGAGAAALTTAGGAPWGDAIEVPGTAALDTGGVADVTSVSCPAAGNCVAGGDYAVSSSSSPSPNQVFVADEVNGTWGYAVEVPGIAALNTRDHADFASVSCGSAGNCAAVGQYYGSSGYQAFVADEVNGTWGDAIQVPGTAALNTSLAAEGESVSCPSAGNCALGGYYADSSGYQAFVADEVNGTWGDAIQVPGTAALNARGAAFATSVSCASAGNCAVGGSYTDSSGHTQAFVADEMNGTWGDAAEVPGTAALNVGGVAEVDSVSCASAGNCAAGGGYTGSSGHTQAFVADEVNGTWGDATEVPGIAALSTSGDAWVATVSCPSAGNCAAGGTYAAGTPPADQAFVVSEVNGTWGDAIHVPGAGGPAQVISVSCASAGNCVAGGDSSARFGIGTGSLAFVISEVNGTWGEAIDVSSAALNADGGEIFSVSCPSADGCAAGGTYYPYGSGSPQPFVVSQN